MSLRSEIFVVHVSFLGSRSVTKSFLKFIPIAKIGFFIFSNFGVVSLSDFGRSLFNKHRDVVFMLYQNFETCRPTFPRNIHLHADLISTLTRIYKTLDVGKEYLGTPEPLEKCRAVYN